MSLAALAIVTSCSKEEKNPKSDTLKSEIRANYPSYFPTTVNGTLKFASQQNVQSFLNYVDSQMKTDSNFLTQLSADLNYASANTIQSETDRFLDKGLSSIFNSHFEAIVGDTLYVQKSFEEYYSIQENDHVHREILRGLQPNTHLNFDASTRGIRVFGDDREVTVLSGSDDCGCSMEVRTDSRGGVSVKLLCPGLIFGQYVTLNWGDGQSSTLFFSGPTTNLVFQHDYSALVDYTITINWLRFNCNGVLSTQDIIRPISLSSSCCKKTVSEKGFKVVGELRLNWEVKVGSGLWGHRVYSNLESKKFKNGNWGDHKASHLEQTHNALYRGLGCDVNDLDNDFDDCNNCYGNSESSWAASSNYNKNINGDVFVNFTMIADGITIMYGHTPKFCK